MLKERLLGSLTVAALFGIASGCGGAASRSAGSSGVSGGGSGAGSGGTTTATAGTGTAAAGRSTGASGTANHAGAGGTAGARDVGGADGLGGAGAGGQNSAGEESTAGAGGSASSSCVKPSGADAVVQGYALPTAGGCSFKPTIGQGSLTLVSEAAFSDFFRCQAGASAGVDFSTHRLRVTILASTTATPRQWAVDATDAIHLGFSPSPSCGGPVAPTQLSMALVPAGTKAIVEDLCTPSCNNGGTGYPN